MPVAMNRISQLAMSEQPERTSTPPPPLSPEQLAMTERLMGEGLIDLLQACELFTPITGRRASLHAMLRWVMSGKRGVCLESVRLGGRWKTSAAAMARFIAGTSQRT